MSPVLEVDVVVVGGGVSGLAAALWVARYRRSVVVVDSCDYRNKSVEISHGYLGRDPQDPATLLEDGRREVLAYPTARYEAGEVSSITRAEDGLFDVCIGDQWLRTHRVILATGVRDAFPSVEGFSEHYGASAFHCPACDGYEARDRDVVALGWDDRLVGFAGTLLNWARSVTVVTDGRRFEGDDSCRVVLARNEIELVEEKAVSLVGPRGDLRAVRLESGRELPCSLLMFSIEHRPRHDLAASLGCAVDADGYVVVDAEGLTSVPGVYACGDLVPGLQLSQVAAGKGVIAGVGAAQSFFGERGAPTSPPPAPDAAAEREAAKA